jgi:uncharacterized protein YdgA (DUF945 family)
LNGRDLRDFANAGVPLLETLSEMLGKTSSEIKDMVENGEISAEMVEQAFMKMTEEGGKFADMMKQTADTRT